MSDSEEESYGFYGKPLEQYDEDAFPKKRPITVEEQIATDAQGRRRFHGAFTGGFSAGFYNTVGSVEGWQPSEFKSSRAEKAQSRQAQKPEDYMDDEDVGEFGIAPSTVKATQDFNTSKKRKKQVFADGPIPGIPVLQSLIESGNETIGYVLLRNMGVKHGEVEEEVENVDDGNKRIYGCQMPKTAEIKQSLLDKAYKIPKIYADYLKNPKINSFGIGYSGLDKTHINLFSSSNVVVKEANNKKLPISGQAFGVGAFEDDDEDIYVKEDLSKYDFEITKEIKKKQDLQTTKLVLGLFVASTNALTLTEKFPPPTIPKSFTGKYKERKSRFAPIEEIAPQEPQRNEIDASIRAKYLGENDGEKTYTASKSTHNKKEPPKKEMKTQPKVEDLMKSEILFDKFVSASNSADHIEILEAVKPSENFHGTIEMRQAARMKMFGPLTRVTISWQPCGLLCKRFNVPEPMYGEFELKHNKKRTKNLIFENEKRVETPVINKSGLTQTKSNDEAINLVENVEDIELPPPNNKTDDPIVDEIKHVDITDKLDVSKNMDLFKAVFFDTDSEESDVEEEKIEEIAQEIIEEEKARHEEIKEVILSQDLLLPKIKPMKQGLLSNVGFIKFTKPNKKGDPENVVEAVEKDPNLYGPKLPERVLFQKPVRIDDVITIEDDWVEKGAENSDGDKSPKKKEHKHKKKSKKHKHKKHKHNK